MWYGKEEKVADSNGQLERYKRLKETVEFKRKELSEMEFDLKEMAREIQDNL